MCHNRDTFNSHRVWTVKNQLILSLKKILPLVDKKAKNTLYLEILHFPLTFCEGR